MFIPDSDFDVLPIPDPGSRGQKGNGSRIRNTAYNVSQSLTQLNLIQKSNVGFYNRIYKHTVSVLEDMKRLDQGHLPPKLEIPGLTCPGRESNPGLHGGRRAL
jgi:hypothetical protein